MKRNTTLKVLLVLLFLVVSSSSFLFAQSRKDLIRKYGSRLKSSGVIKNDLTSAQVDAISKDPGSASSIVEYTGKPLDKTQVRELERDLRASGEMERELTAAEVRIISENPDKAAKIAEITQYAKIKAKEAAANDPNVSEDSMRHVLWSYMLTKEFGADFSEEVTTAHEVGSTNTAEESRKDLQNNELGRQLAAQGMSESDILKKLASSGSGKLSSPGAITVPAVKSSSFGVPTDAKSEPLPPEVKPERDRLQKMAIEKGILKPDYDAAKIVGESTNEDNVLMWIVMTNKQRESLIDEVKEVHAKNNINISRPAYFYVRILDSYVLNGMKDGTITPTQGLGHLERVFRRKALNNGDFIKHESK